MRGYAMFFVVAVMTACLLFLLTTRSKPEWDAPLADPEPAPGAAADAGADAVGAASGSARANATANANADGATTTPPKPGDRPFRVTMLGWELAAPGVAVEGGPKTELAPETTLDAVEERLTRGGQDPAGADVAILPLPAFVAGYEKLRALEPRAFLVVGFSHGREEVHAAAGALLKLPPGADEVKVVALTPATAGDATARAAGSEAATVVGLFALDLLGVPASRCRFVAPGAPEAKGALLDAIVRGASSDRKLAFSTADASRLVPIVAVALKAQLDARGNELQAFSRAWFDGVGRARANAQPVAQKLATKEGVALAAGVGGAPEALAIVDRLGQIDASSLDKQQTLVGPAAARSSVSLEALTQRTFLLARAGGLASSAAPDPLPVDARVVLAIAPAPPETHRADAAESDAGAAFAPIAAGAVPLVLYRAPPDATADVVAAQIAVLSAVFERSAFRVAAKGGEKAARAIAAQARDKHDVAAARLATTTAEPQGAFASVEILALP